MCRFLIAFIFLSFPLFIIPTATHITVIIGPHNRLIFLVAEDHMMDIPDQYNKPIVDKVLEILREAEVQPDGGYNVLLEVSDFGICLLAELIKHKNEFKKNTFEDVDIRKVSRGVLHVFGNVLQCGFFNQFYQGTRAEEADAEEIRKSFQKRYDCDISTATFTDVFEEFERYMLHAREKNELRPNPKDYQSEARCLKRNIERIKAILEKHDIREADSYMDASLTLRQQIGFQAYEVFRQEINAELHEAAAAIMNLFTYERMLDLCEEPSSKPIIFISGASHTVSVENLFKDLGCLRVDSIINLEAHGKGHILHPLKVEDFEVLKKPVTTFEPVAPTIWSRCAIL